MGKITVRAMKLTVPYLNPVVIIPIYLASWNLANYLRPCPSVLSRITPPVDIFQGTWLSEDLRDNYSPVSKYQTLHQTL